MKILVLGGCSYIDAILRDVGGQRGAWCPGQDATRRNHRGCSNRARHRSSLVYFTIPYQRSSEVISAIFI